METTIIPNAFWISKLFCTFSIFFFQTKKLNTKQQKCIRKAWNLRQSMLWNMYSHTNLKGCFKGYHKFHIPNCVYFVSGNLCLPLALMRVFNTPRNPLSHTHIKQCSPLYSKLVRLSVYFAYPVPLQYDVYAWEYISKFIIFFFTSSFAGWIFHDFYLWKSFSYPARRKRTTEENSITSLGYALVFCLF